MTTPKTISTAFTASSTAADVLHGVHLKGLRVVVTGASSGIGAETARALTAAGAQVTLAVRNPAAGEAVAESIETSTGTIRPQVRLLDLADLATVTRFVQEWEGPLHVLINNAGLVTGGLERTPQGWELQFATNHLGHFALATGLQHALALGAAKRDGARIVSLSSTAHMRSGIDFDDLQFQHRRYDPQIAYAQSKTANSLFAVEATRRWASAGIVANAVNPGGVATGLQRNFTTAQRESLEAAEAAGVFTYKTVEQGAATTLVAAIAPQFAHTRGPLPGRRTRGVHGDQRCRPRSASARRQGMGTRSRCCTTPLDRLNRPPPRLTPQLRESRRWGASAGCDVDVLIADPSTA